MKILNYFYFLPFLLLSSCSLFNSNNGAISDNNSKLLQDTTCDLLDLRLDDARLNRLG